MTFGDLQSHTPTARLFKCVFSYSCAAVQQLTRFQLA